MGQAKLRGSFEHRKAESLLRQAKEAERKAKKLAEEQFALNEWRRANPELAEKQAQKLRKQRETQMLLGMASAIGGYGNALRRSARIKPPLYL